MLDVISKKNSFFVIVNDRIFGYSLFGDNETLNIRFVSQQKTLCLSEEFNNILSSVSNNLSERLILCAKIGAESLSAASHIADAHRTGIGMAAHLMECLHLKRADERDERIRERIELLRHESDRKQQNYLIDKNQLPPVDFLVVFEPHMHHFRYSNADDK